MSGPHAGCEQTTAQLKVCFQHTDLLARACYQLLQSSVKAASPNTASSTAQGPLKYYSAISQQGTFFRVLRNFNVTVDNPEQPKSGGLPTCPAPSACIDNEASMFKWEVIPNYQGAKEGDSTWTLKVCDQASLNKV